MAREGQIFTKHAVLIIFIQKILQSADSRAISGPPAAPGRPRLLLPPSKTGKTAKSHRKVSSKGSLATRDPSRDLRLEKLVPQKIPSPDLSIKKKSKSRIFFRNPAVWPSAAGGNAQIGKMCGRRAPGGGRRAPGAGRVAKNLWPLPPHPHTHTRKTAIPRCGRIICPRPWDCSQPASQPAGQPAKKWGEGGGDSGV